MSESELAGVVSARICHDLANPLGAIVNGADLIREIGTDGASDELALVAQSAHRAAALLTFHRLAFGSIGDRGAVLSRDQLRDRIAPVVKSPRLTLTWSVPSGPEVGLAAARLLALMVLAGRSLLGRGGELKVLLSRDATFPAAVMADGPGAAATADHRDWLRGNGAALPDSRQVEFALIGPAAAAAGAAIELIEEPGRLALRARPA